MLWVLVVGVIGFNHTFAVSGIASQEECERLGKEIVAAAGTLTSPTWRCFRYQGKQ